MAQSEGLVMCYISLKIIKDVRRIYEDVMTEKLKILQFFSYSSSTSQLTRFCFTLTYRATYKLHFIFWLLRCTLCLERIMLHISRLFSLRKQFLLTPVSLSICNQLQQDENQMEAHEVHYISNY